MGWNPLVKKLKLAPGASAAVLGGHPGYVQALQLPAGITFLERLSGRFDWIQRFAKTKAELEAKVGRAAKALYPSGLLWVSFPQGVFRLPDRPDPRQGLGVAENAQTQVDLLVSVNSDWSAFALRPHAPRGGPPDLPLTGSPFWPARPALSP
jgi:hypothetical protein